MAKARPYLKCRGTPLSDVKLEEWPVDVSRKTDPPIPIGPPQTVDGVRCVKVYASCGWLRKLVFGHSTFQVHESDLVGCVIRTMRACVTECLSGKRQEQVVEAKPAGLSLLASFESEDEALENSAGPIHYDEPEAKKVRSDSGSIRKPAWASIMLGETTVLARCGKGPTMFIELSELAINALVKAVINECQNSKAEIGSSSSAPWLPASILEPCDSGKIEWSAAKQSFRILYIATNSKTVGTTCVRVPYESYDGKTFSQEQRLKVARSVREKARTTWNSKDLSQRPRYIVNSLEATSSGQE